MQVPREPAADRRAGPNSSLMLFTSEPRQDKRFGLARRAGRGPVATEATIAAQIFARRARGCDDS